MIDGYIISSCRSSIEVVPIILISNGQHSLEHVIFALLSDIKVKFKQFVKELPLSNEIRLGQLFCECLASLGLILADGFPHLVGKVCEKG